MVRKILNDENFRGKEIETFFIIIINKIIKQKKKSSSNLIPLLIKYNFVAGLYSPFK